MTPQKLERKEILFLFVLFSIGVFFRLVPRLAIDPHLLTLNADIWYRLCLAQYLLDHGHLPHSDIRYLAYGHVPVWYPPLGLYFFVFLSKLTSLDLPTVTSRLMPFVESLVILPTYFFCRFIYNQRVAVYSCIALTLTPCFVYWTGISTPQSVTIFFIPIVLFLWIRYVESRFLLNNRWVHLTTIGACLAVNFLFHISYFNLIVILILCQLALIKEKKTTWRICVDLLVPIAFSQLATIWWWGPPSNLYYWWTQVLTTSSGFNVTGLKYLTDYGTVSAFLGYAAFFMIYLLALRKKSSSNRAYYLVVVFWAVYPMIESHVENILLLTQREDLAFNTLVKPLEGFRFYVFLAQPLAICLGLALYELQLFCQKRKIIFFKFITAMVFAGLLFDMLFVFNISQRFQHSRFSMPDIKAAQWFQENTDENARVLTDYYFGQLFSGISGGKALLGSMFPLKNVDIPYITEGWRVLYDIYAVYQSGDIQTIEDVLKRYNCQYVFYSDNALRQIEFLVNGAGDAQRYKQGKYDGLLKIDHSKTLLNPEFFKVVYDQEGRKILQWIKN